MNKGKNILMFSIMIVTLFVIATFAVTYSFFSPLFIPDTSTSLIYAQSGKMIVEFNDDNPDVNFENVLPGPTESIDDAILVKNFTVYGENTVDELQMEYSLKFKVVNNTFDDNDIGYILIGTDKSNGEYVTTAKTEFNSSDIIKLASVKDKDFEINLGTGTFEKSTNGKDSHKYSFYLFYIETGEVQNSQDASFSGYITLTID